MRGGLDGDTQYPGKGVPYGSALVSRMQEGPRLWQRRELIEAVRSELAKECKSASPALLGRSIDRMLELGHLQKENGYLRLLEYEDFWRRWRDG